MKYYRLDRILKHNAQYNFILGSRSTGKSFAVLEYGLEQYKKTGKQMAIIRRWQYDFKGNRGATMFANLCEVGIIKKLFRGCGDWTGVFFQSGRWYLCRYEDEERITATEPFAYAFALSDMEHDKSTSYPNVTTILFDEVITKNTYLNDEFIIFCNVLSTIIRQRDDVKIFMLGNTYSQYSPYYNEMGLIHIKDMKPNAIDVYTYADSKLTVAVEFVGNLNAKGVKSDVYFTFDNPKLNMIRGNNGNIWELNIFPHCPCKYKKSDIIYSFFVEFDNTVLQGDCVNTDDSSFVFLHKKTSDIKKGDDIIYSITDSHLPNIIKNFFKPRTSAQKKILQLYENSKFFYQDNYIGDIFASYINSCKKGAV